MSEPLTSPDVVSPFEEAQAEVAKSPSARKGSELLSAAIEQTLLDAKVKERLTTRQASGGLRAIEFALGEIAAGAVSVGEDVIVGIDDRISQIDSILSEQLTAILHHPDFQQLESGWRGLEHLLDHSEVGPMLHLRVLNATIEELSADFKAKGRWDASNLYQRVFIDALDQPSESPFAALVADHSFSRHPSDIALLRNLSKIAAISHAPIIAAADPQIFNDPMVEAGGTQVDNFIDFHGSIFSSERSLADRLNDAEEWQKFRKTADSRYCALLLPRLLGRLPYDPETVPVKTFGFRERVDGTSPSRYLWSRPVYAFGALLADAFARTGWCLEIRGELGGGKVEDIRVHEFAGGMKKGPIECNFPNTTEAALNELGFISLQLSPSKEPVFVGGATCQDPIVFPHDHPRTANGRLAATLPYVLAVSRVVHYLNKILWRKTGSATNAAQLQAELDEWIRQFTNQNTDVGDELAASAPFVYSNITVEPDTRSGFYKATVELTPRIALEGVAVMLKLEARLPPKEQRSN